ncbi:beta-glucosidase [Gryllotalpicola reticulitermitis]|uniref:Beta-glucosidase n=1 Tax=Gryllotalpicola reticulitermitis TaxID=1184153 RepID=A0ABV8Q754_9MICO
MSPTPSRAAALESADELLARMTLDEKIQQMVGVMSTSVLGAAGPDDAAMSRSIAEGIGHIAGVPALGHQTPQVIAQNANRIQRFLRDHTRLGIPAIIHNEALNGAVLPYHPIFPTAIGLAATWNPDAVGEMAALVREQLRAIGIRQSLSPVMDVARDARWGRMHETYGEDPYLVSAMSVAFTRGMQGDDLRHGVIATAKHFLGYGAGEAGQNTAVTRISERELYEVYARPFEAAIREAGLGSVMNSYSEYDGIPIVASAHVLRTVLREQLGFDGTVISDYAAVKNLVDIQLVARDAVEAGILSLRGGLDVELPVPYGYGPEFRAAAARGEVPLELIDEAVRRVLADKYQLGLFDDPFVDEGAVVLEATAAQSEELSLNLAAESLTLLTNDGVLPLSRTLGKIAIVGPHATDIDFAFPAYTYPASVNMMRAMMQGQGANMAGIEAASEMIGPEAAAALMGELMPLLTTAPDDFARREYGSISLAEAVQQLAPDARIAAVSTGVLDSEPTDFAAVAAAVEGADVVILALGGRPGWFGNALTEGEGSDTADVSLPGNQNALVELVAQSGVPAVAVVSTGRQFSITEVAEKIPAVLWAYYGGQRASQAVAAALFGDVNPGGKLPYSIPRHSGQLPLYAGQHNGSGYRKSETNTNLHYLDVPGTPLFPFGHGIGYTTFEYSKLELPDAPVSTGAESVEVGVTVRNTGSVLGDEVVQLYFAARATGMTRPAQQLVAFRRVRLEPGQSATIRFTVPLALLGYLDVDRHFVVEEGAVGVLVGSSSDDIRLRGALETSGGTREIAPHDRHFVAASTVDELAAL